MKFQCKFYYPHDPHPLFEDTAMAVTHEFGESKSGLDFDVTVTSDETQVTVKLYSRATSWVTGVCPLAAAIDDSNMYYMQCMTALLDACRRLYRFNPDLKSETVAQVFRTASYNLAVFFGI